jgi:hypothetical protein
MASGLPWVTEAFFIAGIRSQNQQEVKLNANTSKT